MLCVGLDCFLFKFRALKERVLTGSSELKLWNIMPVLLFLNQITGVVQLSTSIRQRLYRFVFGGEDGIMSESEINRRKVWEAMVVEQMFANYPFLQAVSLVLTWNDNDFQQLVLNEKATE